MSKSRSFSIYLLKEGYDAMNALKDDHRLEEGVEAADLPEEATLYVLDSPPREPWWKGYFGVRKPLHQVTKGALIFLPVGDRHFALSFGPVYHNLKDASYEYDFGLRVTLNSVDPNRLKSTDILEPGAARRQRTQVPVDSDITYFDFDRDSTILKSLTGKVKQEHEELFKHATGASSLRISSAIASEKLAELCEKLLELYESEAYKTTFPDIQNIAPVRDPVVVEQLNGKLLAALREKSEDLYLTIPDIIDYRDCVCTAFSGEGQSLIYDEAFIQRYYEYLEQHDRLLAEIGIEELKKHALWLTDEDGNRRQQYSILKCLIYDTDLSAGTEMYHLTEGSWYKIENDYIAKLEAFLDPLCADLNLPVYAHDGEGAYNESVAAADGNILCLDKTSMSPAGQNQVEPCDLYAVDDSHAVFNHIKISTLSAQLSHLFNQGANAIELLKLDAEVVGNLKTLIGDKAATEKLGGFLLPIDEQKYHVVYGIVTHKDKAEKSRNLPLFSRISLMRVMKALQLMSVKANYGFVEDASPKKPGRQKKRKKKTEGGALDA